MWGEGIKNGVRRDNEYRVVVFKTIIRWDERVMETLKEYLLN